MSGECLDGFVCIEASFSPTPYWDDHKSGSRINGRCPTGYYCLQGTYAPIPCNEGTYQPASGATECIDCPPGKYCGIKALSEPSGPCAGGYYCSGGAKTSTPA